MNSKTHFAPFGRHRHARRAVEHLDYRPHRGAAHLETDLMLMRAGWPFSDAPGLGRDRMIERDEERKSVRPPEPRNRFSDLWRLLTSRMRGVAAQR